jgi:hypothetical protein
MTLFGSYRFETRSRCIRERPGPAPAAVQKMSPVPRQSRHTTTSVPGCAAGNHCQNPGPRGPQRVSIQSVQSGLQEFVHTCRRKSPQSRDNSVRVVAGLIGIPISNTSTFECGGPEAFSNRLVSGPAFRGARPLKYFGTLQERICLLSVQCFESWETFAQGSGY